MGQNTYDLVGKLTDPESEDENSKLMAPDAKDMLLDNEDVAPAEWLKAAPCHRSES